MFKVTKEYKKARCGEITTPHGTVTTPAFLPCATHGSLRGVGQGRLQEMDAEILLANAYHLYLRPGIERIEALGGLHKFMNWNEVIFTDSGGFQAFALPKFVKFSDLGILFQSHIDGSKHLFTPEVVIDIQKRLGVDIATCLDVCTGFPASEKEVGEAVEQTNRWAQRSIVAWKSRSSLRGDKKSTKQSMRRLPRFARNDNKGERMLLYGMVQGSIYKNLRKRSAEFLANSAFDGFAIGGNMYTFGKSISELKKEKPRMWEIVEYTNSILPKNKPRHLLGVGEPADIIAGVWAGVDTFDCVMATRMARHGAVWVNEIKNEKLRIKNSGRVPFNYHRMNLSSAKFAYSTDPVDADCGCSTCLNGYQRGYVHHLLRINDPVAGQLLSIHNLKFLYDLVNEIRDSIKEDNFKEKFGKFIT